MNYNDILDNNILLICDNDIKNKILSFLSTKKEIYNIKFMNINEVIKKLFFDYDEKTIYYLMDKYNINHEVADNYIKNMYFIEDKMYDSEKLNLLVRYKKELLDNNLLIKDSLFIDYIKKFNIKVCMKKISKYSKYIIDILSKYTNVSIYDFEYKKYEHKVYEFPTMDKEIEYVAYNICELINQGIDINKIKISNIDDDYINNIKRIFSYYKIPINLPSKSYIIGTKIGKDFISNYNSDISKTIMSIDNYKDDPIYNKIIDICNKYTFIDDYLKVKDSILHDLKTTLIPQLKLENAIEIIDYKDIIEDEYVFLMNFNLNKIPKIYKDEDYITDNIKPHFLDNTIEKNKLEKEITIKSIDNIKNLVITFKDKTYKDECYPSNLVEKYAIEKPSINIYKSYSKTNDELKLASSLDRLLKYGIKNDELNTLKYNYDIPYMKYNNKYNKISTNSLNQLLNNKLSLSYTKIQEYNECAFKYYLSNILKLNIYEENFFAILGTIFHHILEIGIKKEIDVDKEIEIFINNNYKDREFSKKEMFFLNNSIDNIKFVLSSIKKQMKLCKLKNIKTEEKVFIDKSKNIKITFSGVIDKLLYLEENDKTIVAIIDYKTGNNVDIDLGYMSYGIGLQLPIYLYLTSNMEFKNIKFAGIYLQKIMPDIPKLKDLEKGRKEDKLKLEGYSNSDMDIISKFDITYNDSEIIKGLKTTKDGRFSSNSKTLNDSQFNSLIDLASNQIDNVVENIINSKFDINPIIKESDKQITACKYCNYKDICFRENTDIRYLKKDKDLSILGGGQDE